MNAWSDIVLTGIYTLTPTHFGTGQTTGAVDLPVARDESTRFPVLPATGLKGVARDYLTGALDSKAGDCLFGKSLDGADRADTLEAGLLAFTEARLIVYPVRSLNRPFLHATCRLILERLARDLRAMGLTGFLPEQWKFPEAKGVKALVADETLAGKALVLEDLVYGGEEVAALPSLQQLGNRLGELLPPDEEDTCRRLASGIVVVPDEDFTDLMQRVIPVRARIKLTGGKTTDRWENPETGAVETGNLWYEEHLPSDCLFVSFIGERRQRTFFQGTGTRSRGYSLATFKDQAGQLRLVQIGGNESVGQGLCYWTLWSPKVTVKLDSVLEDSTSQIQGGTP
jgi:CRISPR-associated protein Cmr4